MLWHADIQNITVDVTFRRKATGFRININTNKYVIEKVTEKYKKMLTLI